MYHFYDQFDTPLQFDLPANESFTNYGNDYPGGNDWGSPTPVPTVAAGAEFTDSFHPPALSSGPFPVPYSPNNGLSTTTVLHLTQSYGAGTTQTGGGRIVQRQTLHYFLTHAEHLDVIKPASP